MCLRLHGLAVACALAVGVGFLLVPAANAQDDNIQEVNFRTVDQVKLTGTIYKSGKGRNSPCVLFVHAWGRDRTKGGWDTLAKELQGLGYNVLSFDLRGHGKSKELDNKQIFWNLQQFPINRYAYSKGRQLPSALDLPLFIDYKDFHPVYHAAMLNDIAGARRYLDTLNDAGELNTGKLFVVAEGDGAMLSLLWAGWEHPRPGIAPVAIGLVPPDHPAGTDISGMVFLTINAQPDVFSYAKPPWQTSRLWSTNRPYGQILEPLIERTPMCFLYGADDSTAKKHSEYIFDGLLKGSDVMDKKEKYKFLVPVEGTTLSGSELLGKAELSTEKTIVDFIEQMKERGVGNNWIARNVSNAAIDLVVPERFGWTVPVR